MIARERSSNLNNGINLSAYPVFNHRWSPVACGSSSGGSPPEMNDPLSNSVHHHPLLPLHLYLSIAPFNLYYLIISLSLCTFISLSLSLPPSLSPSGSLYFYLCEINRLLFILTVNEVVSTFSNIFYMIPAPDESNISNTVNSG